MKLYLIILLLFLVNCIQSKKNVNMKKKGIYENPWETWRSPDFIKFINWRLTSKRNTNLPKNLKDLDKSLPIHQISDKEINEFISTNTSDIIKLIWIGHSTSLLNIENCIILIDPIFSKRAGPPLIGYNRFRGLPITIDRIPRVDAVVISHNHFDHLDSDSVVELNKKFGKTDLNWFVGAGVGKFLKSQKITKNVHELEWWDIAAHSKSNLSHLKFIFTPAQHWSGRSLFDRFETLWGSWVILGINRRFYYAGDTGYCSIFKEIGDKYGPFDLSSIPIGAYEPRFIMGPQHVDPEQAVQIHIDVKSKKSVGCHWGTFSLANEFYLEPKTKLDEEVKKRNLIENSFLAIQHGGTLSTE